MEKTSEEINEAFEKWWKEVLKATRQEADHTTKILAWSAFSAGYLISLQE